MIHASWHDGQPWYAGFVLSRTPRPPPVPDEKGAGLSIPRFTSP